MNIKKRCNKSGCRELIDVTDTYCKEHTNDDYKQYNKARYRNDKEYVRFYGSKSWREIRYQRLLIDDFICQHCKIEKQIFKEAEMVHHMYNRRDYPEEELNIDTLVSLCNACHEYIESSNDRRYVWTK